MAPNGLFAALTTRKARTSFHSFLPTIVSNLRFSSVGQPERIKKHHKMWCFLILGSPKRIRTVVLALKGRCPGPLDDGAKKPAIFRKFPKMPANYNCALAHCQETIFFFAPFETRIFQLRFVGCSQFVPTCARFHCSNRCFLVLSVCFRVPIRQHVSPFRD